MRWQAPAQCSAYSRLRNDAAVRRRVSGGSVEPVMLRDYDLHEAVGKGIG